MLKKCDRICKICEFSHIRHNFHIRDVENAIICGKICDMWISAKNAIAYNRFHKLICRYCHLFSERRCIYKPESHRKLSYTQACYYYYQGPRLTAATFAKFSGTICEIPWHYYPQIPYILRPVGIVVLTNKTSKYEEFIVTCDTKTLH